MPTKAVITTATTTKALMTKAVMTKAAMTKAAMIKAVMTPSAMTKAVMTVPPTHGDFGWSGICSAFPIRVKTSPYINFPVPVQNSNVSAA